MLAPLSGQNFHNKAAVFMDRDGTLNVSNKPDGSYLPVNQPEDLVLFDQAKEGLAELTRQTDLLKVLVTNQGGIGSGFMTVEQLKKIDEKLLNDVRGAGGDIDAIYFASSNDKADPMRKPNPGMLLKAADELGIDLTRSYMVGDMTTDISAGEKADEKVVSIGLETGSGCKDNKVDIKPDVMVKDFKAAAEFIIADHNKRAHT
jgi:D-glycero-D-manno-heptose 1,7-bisphosphate phosphatase